MLEPEHEIVPSQNTEVTFTTKQSEMICLIQNAPLLVRQTGDDTTNGMFVSIDQAMMTCSRRLV